MVLAVYVLMVLDIIGHLVPIYVAQAGFRRAVQSTGFNRWIYGYVSLVASCALGFLCTIDLDALVFYLLAQAGAWLTLPLWFLVRELTPRSAPVRQGRSPAAHRLVVPLRLETEWRITGLPEPLR